MTGKPKKYNKHFAATREDFTRTLLPFSASMRQHQTACSKPPETQGAKLLCLSLAFSSSVLVFLSRYENAKEKRKKKKRCFQRASFLLLSLAFRSSPAAANPTTPRRDVTTTSVSAHRQTLYAKPLARKKTYNDFL
jgi:hypothetical protein